MTNYKDAPETTPYGKPMVINLRGGGIFEILGTQGNGFMFEKEAAERFLSPAALSRAVEHDGYLCFAEKTTGNIVVYELGVGKHFQDMTQKDVKKATLHLIEHDPAYFKERGIQPIKAKSRQKQKAPRMPER